MKIFKFEKTIVYEIPANRRSIIYKEQEEICC